ncbi:MAG: aldo/keto reductase, partial [Alphaproteobacteria bacterium]|nr:aldo/keto reductase [Alphaproteobacteria bacterium]
EALAKHHDRSPAQTALQFAFQINAGGPVLVGVTNRKHLAENVEALSKPPLTEADIEELRAL